MPYPRRPLDVRLWRKVPKRVEGECWLWVGKVGNHGYGVLSNPDNGSDLLAHRVAWIVTNGVIPKGVCLLHSCDVRLCCNPAHLTLGTRKGNAADRDAKGRTSKGEEHGRHVLTEEDVKEIRSSPRGYNRSIALGKRYGVSWRHIYSVWNGKLWKHLLLDQN